MSGTRVLHICSYYTGSKLYENLVSALDRLGIEQDVYVFVHKGSKQPGRVPLNVHYAPCFWKHQRAVFHLKHLRVLRDIKKRFDLDRYDVSHAHSLFSNGYIAYRLKEEYGLPYIVAVRNTDVNTFFGRMPHLRRLGVNILKDAKAIVFISKPYKEYTIGRFVPQRLRQSFRQKSIVLPNGIDNFWHANKFFERKPPKSKTVKIIYVGQISPNKNVETTITACNLLIQQGYNVSFTVVGKIANKRYERLFKDTPFLRYVPYCSKEELIKCYRASDIFVMPSKRETFGLVYAEAMSQALPVIYTRDQGFDGQFPEGEVGYSVSHNSAGEIAEKIRLLLENYGTVSEKALNNVDVYDWSCIAKNYVTLYS